MSRFQFGKLLRRHFLAGLLIVTPILVIGWILGAIVRALWVLPTYLPDQWQPTTLFQDPTTVLLVNTVFTVAVMLLLAVGIAFVGWVSKHYIGRKALEFIGEVIQRIPLIRSIYSALDQLLRAFGTGEGAQFSRVVYVEYPRKGSWAIAFVTGPARAFTGSPDRLLNLYIPTTPNPTSGFHLMVPESEVKDSTLSVEQAFKTILSLGIAQ